MRVCGQWVWVVGMASQEGGVAGGEGWSGGVSVSFYE